MTPHTPPTGRGPGWRRPALVGAVTAAALGLLAAVGYTLREPPPPLPSEPVLEVGVARLVEVPGGTAAFSPAHGPRVVTHGRASGFSHDAVGAAVAASNLATRLSPSAGPAIYEPTLAEQCWGDTATQRHRLRFAPTLTDDTAVQADAQARRVRVLYFRIVAGDPAGDRVTVSLLADTAQAAARGALARTDLTLRWADGDWRLLVPLPGTALQAQTRGYRLLGRAA
jgi:hypothetical protein